MGRFVIVVYAPKPGQDAALSVAIAKHMDVLRAEDLITERPAYLMRATDGSILEVFEWRSLEAIEQAHQSPRVAELWAEFDACCTYVPLNTLTEAQNLFADFEPLDTLAEGQPARPG